MSDIYKLIKKKTALIMGLYSQDWDWKSIGYKQIEIWILV